MGGGGSVQPAASHRPPPSHVAWVVVVVAMVAVFGVGHLQAGLPLRTIAIRRLQPGAARWALLKEI